MATNEARSEVWHAGFVPNDSDLDYLNSDHEGRSSHVIASLEGRPENRSSQRKMVSSIESNLLSDDSTFSSKSSMDLDSQPSEPEVVFPNLRRSSLIGCDKPNAEHEPTRKDRESSPIPLDLPSSYKKPRTQENHLYVTDSWLFKGIKEHIDDLHFSDVVLKNDNVVTARRKVDVLGEYTFIETTPSQEKETKVFPAIYVPGNAYSWKTIQPQSNLHEGRQPVVMGDEHHARQPSFPYEPTLRALLALQNEHETPVNMRTVEIFTDAEVLAQLFTLISDPARTRPFRLELSTVRNTLFIEKGRHHGEGHTEKGGPIKRAMPVWTTNALRRVGFEEPRLPFSGGHYRVVRYRMGNLVCAVRGKIDFVYENRKTPSQATFDPLRGVHPTAIVENITTPLDREENGNGNTTAQDDDQKEHVIQTWRTAVKHLGMGTKPDRTGKLSLRFAWESDAACLTRLMRTELPLLWFARTTYLVDALVTQNLTVVESKLRAVRGTSYHRAWERAHQTDLRLLAAILHKMKRVTRGVGGTCILVCDPVQRCFMVMKPVVKKWPIPEEVAVQLWGPEDDPAETEYESTAESKSSGLSTLRSRTPSGFTDWTLDEEIKKAGRMMGTDDQGRGRRDVTSRALVSQWLGGYHPDDLDDKMDIDVDEASSDELAPNDSQSRCGEASSFSEEDNDLVRYGVDGSMDVDEVDDEYTYAYADDEAEDGYESFDEEQDDEYDEDESGGESNNQYEHGHDDHQEDECDLETEQGDVRLHFGAKNNVISDEPEPNRSNGKPTPTESLRVYGQRYMC